MSERKLASVQVISEISPIEEADSIECAHVLGWTCVVGKGQFQPGQLCVYLEVDSFLPICEQFEFLRKSCYKNNEFMGEGFRLRSQRFRRQISQGLILPMTVLPNDRDFSVGTDVTELLGIRKWEVPEMVTDAGTAIAEFPSFVSKTDELRVQSFPELISEFLAVPEYYISTKMDGTSVTMYWKEGHLGVCGRNFEYANDGRCSMWEYANQHNLETLLRENAIPDVAIQGEFCGAGIQRNRLKLRTPEWFVFTVVDIQTRRRYSLKDMQELCNKLHLTMVPIEEQGASFPYTTVAQLIERAKGKYASGSNKEGIVIRPTVPVYSPTLKGPLSMKVLNNDYLLKD